MPLSLPIVVTFLFFLALLVVAAWGMRQTSNVNDFFLGGRTFGPWIMAVSYGAAYFSAVIFVGFAGQFGWKFGLSALWVGVANAVIGGGLAWFVLGSRTRRMTHNLGVMTMPDFFSARFDTNGMKVIAALIIFVFLLPYTASVFKGLAHLFDIVLGPGFPFETVLIVITVVSFFYVTFGGYKAIARIDFLLGAIMFVGSILMVGVLIHKFGGIGQVFTHIPERLAERTALPASNPEHIVPAPWFVLPAVIFMTSFGVWGLPQMVHKFYAISDEKQIFRGAVITTLFALVIGCAAYLTGSITHLMNTETPVVHFVPSETDTISLPQTASTFPPLKDDGGGGQVVDFDKLVPDLVNAMLPQWLMALILLLVLSASLSTLSSLVLVSASAVTLDLYKGYINRNADRAHELWVMRSLCGLFIVLAYVIARNPVAWIATLMSLSWGATAGAFMAPYMYGLFWKRTTKLGAYAGMWTGLLVSNGAYAWIACRYGTPQAQLFSTVIASAAMVLPFLVVPIVSCFTKPPRSETVEKAFA